MTQHSKCPGCHAPISLDRLPPGSAIPCPKCGMMLRPKARAKASAGASPAEPPPPVAAAVPDGPAPNGEVVGVAPERAPSRPAIGEGRPRIPKRKGKRKGKRGANPLARVNPRLVAGGLGLGVFFLIVAVVAVRALLHRGTAAGADGGNYVIVDTPQPDVAADAAAAPAGTLVAAPPAEPTAPAPPRKAARETPAAPPEPKPAWDVPVDPKPAADPTRYAADLAIALEGCEFDYNQQQALPLLADMGGPFALPLPAWPKNPRGVNPHLDNKTGKLVIDVAEFPQPPLPVIDLRTGKPAGAFDWKTPFWRDARLSPDGTYLVGPDAVPERMKAPEKNVLFVWKQGEDKPAAKLTMPGPVIWLEFIAADRLAVQTSAPAPEVRVWDVARGETLKTIPLTAEQAPPAPVTPQGPNDTRVVLFYRPWPYAGAVSPGGRYTALGSKTGITLVSLAEGRVVGTVAVPGLARGLQDDYLGLSFSPDGAELFAVVSLASRETRLLSWSAANGKPLTDAKLADGGFGPPIAGPEPGTVVLPGGSPQAAQGAFRAPWTAPALILNTQTGVPVLRLDYAVLRWSDAGPVVAAGGLKYGPEGLLARHVGPPDLKATKPDEYAKGIKDARQDARFERIFGVYSGEIDRAKCHEVAAQATAGAAPRPTVTAADRSAVKAVIPEPPAAWSAPPAAARPGPPAEATLLPDAPVAYADGQAAVLHFETKPLPRPRLEGTWVRYDLRTGQRLGKPVLLWPWLTDLKVPFDPLHPLTPPSPPPPAALTADGERFAACDPAVPGRVDVWTFAGERLLGFYPEAPGQNPEWLGWAADGRLLTLANGTLTAWEVPAGKAVYQVDGGYTAPVDMAAGRGWLAVAAGAHVDLLETSTGRCLGRCRAGGVSGKTCDLAVSPDGRRLAAVFPGAAADLKGAFTAVFWDLTTGKADLASFGTGPYGTLHWGGPQQVLVCTHQCELFDLAARARVAGYNFPVRSGQTQVPALARSADGRLWVHVPNPRKNPELTADWVWKALNVPNARDEQDGIFLAGGREYVSPPKGPIRIEADLGTSGRSRALGQKVAAELQKQGFTIGPKGWTLRISHEVADSGQLFTRSVDDRNAPHIPMVRFTWRLLDPDGKEVWKEGTAGRFPNTGSRYYVKSKRGDFAALESPYAREIDYYDFGYQGMHDAIVEEILDRQADSPWVPSAIPRWLLKAGGAYHRLPVTLDLLRETGS